MSEHTSSQSNEFKEYKCSIHGYGYLTWCDNCQKPWEKFITDFPVHDTNNGRIPEPLHMEDSIARKLGLGKYQHQRWVTRCREAKEALKNE